MTGLAEGRTRAVSPVVGKALEAAIVVLFVSVLVASLYGQAVPGYRAAAGQQVGERVLATAAERVQQAVPPAARRVHARVRVDLPRTVRGRGYTIRTDGHTLVFDHPTLPSQRATVPLPDRVGVVTGTWRSRKPMLVRVTTSDTGLVVRLEAGGS